ncbi:hypothetical protein EME01_02440 [Sinorhizobium meliloti]|nr:hypothetical protein EME01_02440 [Sinorhizobium meliloti]
MIERFRNVLIRATVGGLAFSAIAVSGAMAEETKEQARGAVALLSAARFL